MHRSGTSLVLEWAGKAQAVSVFVLVTQQREADGLSRGVGFPEGISALKYCLEFIKSIQNSEFSDYKDANAWLILQ